MKLNARYAYYGKWFKAKCILYTVKHIDDMFVHIEYDDGETGAFEKASRIYTDSILIDDRYFKLSKEEEDFKNVDIQKTLDIFGYDPRPSRQSKRFYYELVFALCSKCKEIKEMNFNHIDHPDGSACVNCCAEHQKVRNELNKFSFWETRKQWEEKHRHNWGNSRHLKEKIALTIEPILEIKRDEPRATTIKFCKACGKGHWRKGKQFCSEDCKTNNNKEKKQKELDFEQIMKQIRDKKKKQKEKQEKYRQQYYANNREYYLNYNKDYYHNRRMQEITLAMSTATL